MNKTKKKARDSVLDARELYEEWMDGKTPTPTPSRIETPKNQKLVRQKSHFKFHEDYKRDVPSRYAKIMVENYGIIFFENLNFLPCGIFKK